ncbi:MAG: cell division protein FtsX [Candidatus Paceibacterales bacterium]
MFTPLKRIFRSGWQNFSRDGEIALATIFILFLAISLVTSLFLFKDISQFLISNIQEKVDISVYFREEASEEDILDVKEEVSQFLEVKGIKYVSREQALEDFVEKHKQDPALMGSIEEVGGNPLLASLNIKAWEAGQYEKISNFLLEKTDFKNLIEKVDYHQRKPVIEKILSLTSIANRIGISFSLILVIIAILVTFNTIRLSIINRQEEIKIQRLVGASNWFIRGPFLVQGAISGIISTFICLLVFSLILWGFGSKTEIFFPGLNLFNFFLGNFWALLSVQLATGIGLGVISSTIAIRRYLKV